MTFKELEHECYCRVLKNSNISGLHTDFMFTFSDGFHFVQTIKNSELVEADCESLENYLCGLAISEHEKFLYSEKHEKKSHEETYTVSFVISESNDMSAMTVSKTDGDKVKIINLFIGAEADWMMKRLTTPNLFGLRIGDKPYDGPKCVELRAIEQTQSQKLLERGNAIIRGLEAGLISCSPYLDANDRITAFNYDLLSKNFSINVDKDKKE